MKISTDAVHDAIIAAFALANFAKMSKERQAQLIAHAVAVCEASIKGTETGFNMPVEGPGPDDWLDESELANSRLLESLFNLERATGQYMCDCAWDCSGEADRVPTETKLTEFKSRIAS